MRRILALAVAIGAVTLIGAGPALACGGLIAPNGAVNLLRTSTLSAYHDGIEHYVTSFEFAGGGAKFGSIVPLPDVPTRVIKGGDWTLQRLAIETQPQNQTVLFDAAGAETANRSAKVIYETRVGAVNVRVVEGGGFGVGKWAKEQGFNLPPDAPEVLDFYAQRSPIFMALTFDPKLAREQGLVEGDGVPIHAVIPTGDPWVPLRILTLGQQPDARVEADVYLLTDESPSMLPNPAAGNGLFLKKSAPASDLLLADLRSDRGMSWLPQSDMWLTYIGIDSAAKDLTYDLAIDATGEGRPSPVDAGFSISGLPVPDPEAGVSAAVWILAALVALGAIRLANRTTERA